MKYTRQLAPAQAAAPGYEHLLKEMDGAPHDSLQGAKLGFSTEMALSYSPTVVKRIAPLQESCTFDEPAVLRSQTSNLLPYAFHFHRLDTSPRMQHILAARDGTTITALMLKNDDASVFVRDMDADHLWYVYQGSGRCYTELGILEYAAGDFIYVPRCVLSGFVSASATKLIGIQSESGLLPACRSSYDNADIPFKQASVRVPQPYHSGNRWEACEVEVKRDRQWSIVTYAFAPFLCAAWDGTIYPFAIHTSKLNFAYTTTVHADPSNFAVFAAPDASAVVSVLGPRFVHSLPYHHLNTWDEFLFYAKEYDARQGSEGGVGESGTATLHPQGIWHGPQMAAFEKWMKEDAHKRGKLIPWMNDLAIMFETRSPLRVCPQGQGILVDGYEKSWHKSWQEYQARYQHGVGIW